MKRLITFALLLLTITAGAQEQTDSVKPKMKKVEITTDFNMAGDAVLLAKSNKISRSDFKPLKWELTNQLIGNVNFITLKITNEKTGNLEEIKSWKENAHLMMEINDKKQKIYTVYDDTFIHMRIVELPQGNGILLFSALREQ